MNNYVLNPTTDGETLIFGDSDIKNKITTKILFKPFSDCVNEISENANDIAVVCLDTNFPFGRKIKESFLNAKKRVEQFVLSESDVSFNSIISLAANSELLVAVGDENLFSEIRLAAEFLKIPCALVPINCRQSNILSSYSYVKSGSGIIKTKSKAAEYVVLDTEFYLSLKKQYALEAFAETISATLDISDYKIAALKGVTVYDRKLVNFLGEGINLALNPINYDEPQTALLIATIKLSAIKEYTPFFEFSSSEKVADYLGKIFPAPFGERKYRAFTALLPIIKIYLNSNLDSFYSIPNPTLVAREMSETLREKEYDSVKNIADIPKPDEISAEKKLKRVIKYSFSKDIDELIKKSENFQKTYDYFYSGRRRLSDYTPKQMKKAIKFAAYSSENNLLSMIKNEGFAELL